MNETKDTKKNRRKPDDEWFIDFETETVIYVDAEDEDMIKSELEKNGLSISIE